VPNKSSVKILPKVLDIFFVGKLHIIYMNRGTRFSSSGESDMSRIKTVGFHSTFLGQF
jgi:hypothetical protein